MTDDAYSPYHPPPQTDPGPRSALEDYLGQPIVIDTRSPYIIIGTLRHIGHDYLTLESADVHDTTTSSTTKDQYIIQAARVGLCTNRAGAKVRIAEIISISLLKDVQTT